MNAIDLYERLYSDALELVCMGETRDATRSHLIDAFPKATPDDVSEAMGEAYDDVRKNEIVDREDIDPSWFTS
jgi:hypothetical protein